MVTSRISARFATFRAASAAVVCASWAARDCASNSCSNASSAASESPRASAADPHPTHPASPPGVATDALPPRGCVWGRAFSRGHRKLGVAEKASTHTLPRGGTDFVATEVRKLCQKNNILRTCYTEVAQSSCVTSKANSLIPSRCPHNLQISPLQSSQLLITTVISATFLVFLRVFFCWR